MAIDSTISFVTDIQDVRAALDLEPDYHERDEILEDLVNQAARFMEDYSRRNLKQRAYSGVFLDGTGLTQMYLPQHPALVAGLAVNVDTNRTFAASTDLVVWDESTNEATAAVILSPDDGLMTRIDGGLFESGVRTVKVSYTGGIATADAGSLIQAQTRLVQDWWHRIASDPLLSQESAGGISRMLNTGTGPFATLAAQLNPFVRGVLDGLKRATWDTA